jgi:anti-sigma regulatory factor (Ser/Thr protein kinase)
VPTPPTRILLAGHTADLARARRHVVAWAGAAGLDDRTARRLVQAVDETVANVVEHGLDRRSGGQISVEAHLHADQLTISVRHHGPRFDPTTEPTLSPAQSVRQRAQHGYGLPLIRRFVDEVDYRFARGLNELRLTVRRRGA